MLEIVKLKIVYFLNTSLGKYVALEIQNKLKYVIIKKINN